MVWILIFAWLCLIALTIALFVWSSYHSIVWPIIVCFVASFFGWMLALESYNRALDYQRSKCENWGQSAMLETKYVNIGYGDWTCWAYVNDKWLPIERVRAFNEVD